MTDQELEALVVPVVVDAQRLDREMRRLERESRAAGRKTGEAFGEGAGELGVFRAQTEGAALALRGALMIGLDRAAQGVRGLLGFVTRTTTGLVDLGALGLLNVSRGLRAMAEDTRDANGEMSATGKVAAATSSGLERVAKIALTASGIMTGLQIAAAGTAATLLVLSHRASAEFAPAWNRVLVSLGGGGDEFQRLRAEVSALAGELGVDGVTAANTFYEIIGSMPQLLAEPARAMEILRVSLEAGSTGFTDAAMAAKASAAILSAFSLEAEEARRVSDALFMAQGLGATTYGEIAESIGRVSGLTAALGGEFEELLGIIATLTPTGQSTSEVMTQVRSALTNIIKPSVQAKEAAAELGIEFNAAALEAKGLNGFLRSIIESTGGKADILARLFGSDEALALLVALSDKTAELDRWTREIKNSAGATADAVDQMNESWERQKEILGSQLSDILRQIGFQFESLGVVGLKTTNAWLEAWIKLRDETRKYRQDLVAVAEVEARRGTAPTFSLPATTVRPSGPRRSDPIERPLEPTGIEYSQEKIQAFEQQLRATAVAQYALTRNTEAYEEAMRRAQERVNALILSEAQRLRAAGAEEGAVNELLGSYRVLAPKQDRERQRLLDEAASLRDQLAGMMAGLTATATDEAARALDRFEADLREKVQKAGAALSQAEEDQLARLRENISHLGALEGFDREMGIAADAEASREAERALESLITRMRAYVATHGEVNGALAEGTQLREDYNRRIAQGEKALERNRSALAKEAEDRVRAEERRVEAAERAAEERLRNLRDQARSLDENIRGALQLAEAFGMIDAESGRALQNVSQLATSVVRLIGGDLSAIPAALGAVASLGAQFFGESTADKERKAIIERNTDALKELERRMSGLSLTGATLGSARESLTQLTGGKGPLGDQAINYFVGAARNPDSLHHAQNERLLAEIEAAASALNIDLYDGQGRPIHEAWRQLLRALDLAEDGLTRFSGSLEDQRALRDARANIFDEEATPQAEIESEFKLLNDFAPKLLESLGLGDVDLSVPEEVEAAIRTIFEGIEAGTIPAEVLGQLPDGVRTLLEMVLRVEGSLDGLRESSEKTASSMSNVPELFDLALRRRQAAYEALGAATAATPSMDRGSLPAEALDALHAAQASPWTAANIQALIQTSSPTPIVERLDRLRAAIESAPRGGDVTLQVSVPKEAVPRGGWDERELADQMGRVAITVLRDSPEAHLYVRRAAGGQV